MAHIDIYIEFELAGKPFAAIGFLGPQEELLLGGEAMQRLHSSGRQICDDVKFIWEHRQELPERVKDYWLVSAREHDPIYFIYLWGMGKMRITDWQSNAFGLMTPWREDVLVIVELDRVSNFNRPWVPTSAMVHWRML